MTDELLNFWAPWALAGLGGLGGFLPSRLRFQVLVAVGFNRGITSAVFLALRGDPRRLATACSLSSASACFLYILHIFLHILHILLHLLPISCIYMQNMVRLVHLSSEYILQ